MPVEMVQFLLKILLKQNSCCVPRFPLSVSCYKIVNSQTSVTFCYGVGNFGKVGAGVRVGHFISDSVTLICDIHRQCLVISGVGMYVKRPSLQNYFLFP